MAFWASMSLKFRCVWVRWVDLDDESSVSTSNCVAEVKGDCFFVFSLLQWCALAMHRFTNWYPLRLYFNVMSSLNNIKNKYIEALSSTVLSFWTMVLFFSLKPANAMTRSVNFRCVHIFAADVYVYTSDWVQHSKLIWMSLLIWSWCKIYLLSPPRWSQGIHFNTLVWGKEANFKCFSHYVFSILHHQSIESRNLEVSQFGSYQWL